MIFHLFYLTSRRIFMELTSTTNKLPARDFLGPWENLAAHQHGKAYSRRPPVHIWAELHLDASPGLPYPWKHGVPLLLVSVTELFAVSVLLLFCPRHHLADGDDGKE